MIDATSPGAVPVAPSGPRSGEPMSGSSNSSDARLDDLWSAAIKDERAVAEKPAASSARLAGPVIRDFLARTESSPELDRASSGDDSQPTEFDDVPSSDHCDPAQRCSDAALLSTLLAAANAEPFAGHAVYTAPGSRGPDGSRPAPDAVGWSAADVQRRAGLDLTAGATCPVDEAGVAQFDTVVTVMSIETHRSLNSAAPLRSPAAGPAATAGAGPAATPATALASAKPLDQPWPSEPAVDAASADANPGPPYPPGTTLSGRRGDLAGRSATRVTEPELSAAAAVRAGSGHVDASAKVSAAEAVTSTRADGAAASSVMPDRDRAQQPPHIVAQLGGAVLRELTQMSEAGSASAASGAGTNAPMGWRSGITVMKQLIIELEPADLGRVSVRIRLTDGELELAFRADRGNTRALIEAQKADLGDRLANAGYAVDGISVATASVATALDRSERAGVNAEYKEPQSSSQGRTTGDTGFGEAGGRRGQSQGDQRNGHVPVGGPGVAADEARRSDDRTERNSGVFV